MYCYENYRNIHFILMKYVHKALLLKFHLIYKEIINVFSLRYHVVSSNLSIYCLYVLEFLLSNIIFDFILFDSAYSNYVLCWKFTIYIFLKFIITTSLILDNICVNLWYFLNNPFFVSLLLFKYLLFQVLTRVCSYILTNLS